MTSSIPTNDIQNLLQPPKWPIFDENDRKALDDVLTSQSWSSRYLSSDSLLGGVEQLILQKESKFLISTKNLNIFKTQNMHLGNSFGKLFI